MLSFEEVCKRIFADPSWFTKVMVGGLLSFFPILNILAMGYMYQFVRQVRRQGDFQWPEWEQWDQLFLDGLRFFGIWGLCCLVPVLLGWAMALVLDHLVWGMLGIVSYVVLSPVLLLVPAMIAAALYRFQSVGNWECLLDWRPMVRMMIGLGPKLFLPSFAMWGLVALGLPLYGFAVFLGFNVVLLYFTLAILAQEKEMRAAAATYASYR